MKATTIASLFQLAKGIDAPQNKKQQPKRVEKTPVYIGEAAATTGWNKA